MKKDISKEIASMKEMLEISIQQKSGSESDMKREIILIKEHLKENDKAWERNDSINALILDQTTKTNGNVRGLQLLWATVKGWMMGFGISIAIIVALIAFIFNTLNSAENQTQKLIENHIQQTQK